MAFEKRLGTDRRYFCRHRRIDGRPIKVYVGNGPAAAALAEQDAEARAAREADRAKAQQMAVRLQPLGELIAGLDEEPDRVRERRREGQQPRQR